MLSILSCVCWQSVYLLWRNVYLGLLPIFGLGSLFFWYWAAWATCKFWRLILCQLLHLQMFSPILRVLFLSCLLFALLCKSFLSFIRSHLFIFVFIYISLGGGSKRILLWFMSWSVLPMFSSKSFIVSGLTFRSLIHFEFIFVYGVRECSNFILLHVAIQFSQPTYWTGWLFSTVYSCLLYHLYDKVTVCAWVYLWAFYPVPLIYISVFVQVAYCFVTVAL